MKILYVYFHNYSDMPYHTREWTEAAVELGHEVTVLTSIDPAFLKSISWPMPGISIVQVPFPKLPSVAKYFMLLLNMRKKLKEILKENKFDLIYERFSLFSLATASLAGKNFPKYAIELNGITNEEIKLRSSRYFYIKLISKVQRYAFGKADKIIAVTGNIRDYIIETAKITGNKVAVFPNGVNESRFVCKPKNESRALFQIPQDAFVVGYLGTLAPWQGIDTIINSATDLKSKIGNIFFLIGGGQEPMYSELKRIKIEKELQGYVSFPGQIHWDSAADFISTFDIAVSVVKYVDAGYEVSPLKIASYMACEKPVIGTDVMGIKHLLSDKNTGIICKKDDVNSFISAVLRLYNMTHGERDEMGKRGRKLILENFTWKRIVGETLNEIINKRNLA